MTYLDFERLNEINPTAFQSQRPYPWISLEGLLTKEGYWRLRDTLPDISLLERHSGKSRKYRQKSYDRLALEYSDDLDVASPWKEFVAELRGREYQDFLGRLMGVRAFKLSYHWHYTPNGCSVSPPCDANRKLGSHIFYFNTAEDWDPAWGGETLILDDGERFERKSAPKFEDFDLVIGSATLGNRSLLFARKENSWQGVREIHCAEGALRKVFIVVIDRWNLGYSTSSSGGCASPG